MKKKLAIILVFFGLISCKSQEVNGVWMSYNDRVISYDYSYSGNISGIIIDFDKSEIGSVSFDTLIPIEIDYKKKLLKIKNDTIKAEFQVYKNDSIEIELSDNIMSVFHPLDLSHSIPVNLTKIENYLINNSFKKTNESLDIEFSSEYFFRDVIFEKPNKRKALINKSWNEEGYWYVKEVEQNFFLIFTIVEFAEQNIYQIISLDKCIMHLVQLQEDEFENAKITELKTCL